MKSKVILFSATIATLSCLYLLKLDDKVVEFTNPTILAYDEVKNDVIANTAAVLQKSEDSWKPIVSRHVLRPDRENTVKGRKGTELVFPPNVFVDENGFTTSGSVVLTLEECYSIPEILQAKLSTTSNDKILETAGMIKLTAKADGKELHIAEGKDYTIKFPKNGNPKDDFVLFYGERNDDGIMNWTLAENNELPQDEENTGDEDEPMTANLSDAPENCFIAITNSYLRRDLKISEMDYFNWQLTNGEGLNEWFVAGFNPDLQMVNDFCNNKLECQVTFKVNDAGEFDSYYISHTAGDAYDNVVVEFLRTMPPLDLEVLMPKYTYEHACILTFGSHIGRTQNEIAAKFKSQFKKNPEAEMANVKQSELDFYVLTSSELGWINCDRFYEEDSERVDFYVDHNSANDCSVSLVFEDINSVLKGVTEGNRTHFADIPSGMKVRIVSIEDRNGTPQMAVQSANTSDEVVRMKNYDRFSIVELDQQFSRKRPTTGVVM